MLFSDAGGIGDERRRCLQENGVLRRSAEFDFGAAAGHRLFELTFGPQQPDRVLMHAVDITECTGLEGQLRQAHKMEAVGRLVVEDEPAVRAIATRVLRRQGYVVLEAAGGSEALAVSAAFTSVIHVVISDAVMPGMGGAEVVRRLQQQRPGLKSLFMSGYTDDEIVRRGIVASAVHFVQKPFALADFSRGPRRARRLRARDGFAAC